MTGLAAEKRCLQTLALFKEVCMVRLIGSAVVSALSPRSPQGIRQQIEEKLALNSVERRAGQEKTAKVEAK